MAKPVRAVEIRVLDGPNLYFPRPAIKLTADVPGWSKAADSVVAKAGRKLDVSAAEHPGAAGSEQRARVVARMAAALTRRIAVESGRRRLAVRARTYGPERIIVAFPWQHLGAAKALADAAARGLDLCLRRDPMRVAIELGHEVATADPGPEPSVPDPEIPVVQVTGTNGKTTTVRLLAHLVEQAGMKVAYCSTDGVYRGSRRVVQGDYSGFGGAALVLAQRPDVAVLETARGGILLRGAGVMHNDVAVVTNVSADHLGLHGIDTLDQLAEVKAVVPRITRPGGWDVLNADDPRVLSMRRVAGGRPWLFSLDPDNPGIRDVLAAGGRAITVLDNAITWLEDSRAHHVLSVLDVPVALSGLSSMYTQNALAAAAAGLAGGLPHRAVVRGLRTFVPDPRTNPGRANLFELDGRTIVIDYAHNEAGMIGLTEILQGVCPPGGEIWLAIGTAGDRTDEILRSFAMRAAMGSDHLSLAELTAYLRGRERSEVLERLREGAAKAGDTRVPSYESEMQALRSMLRASRPNDVVGLTALSQRPQVFRSLRRRGARRLGPWDIRRIARRRAR